MNQPLVSEFSFRRPSSNALFVGQLWGGMGGHMLHGSSLVLQHLVSSCVACPGVLLNVIKTKRQQTKTKCIR